jgi:hypothetical protein
MSGKATLMPQLREPRGTVPHENTPGPSSLATEDRSNIMRSRAASRQHKCYERSRFPK